MVKIAEGKRTQKRRAGRYIVAKDAKFQTTTHTRKDIGKNYGDRIRECFASALPVDIDRSSPEVSYRDAIGPFTPGDQRSRIQFIGRPTSELISEAFPDALG